MSLCQCRVNWCRKLHRAAPFARVRTPSQALCLHTKASRGQYNVRPSLRDFRGHSKLHSPSFASFWDPSLLRFAHNGNDVRKKIINLFGEFEPKDAKDDAIQPTTLERAALPPLAAQEKGDLFGNKESPDGNEKSSTISMERADNMLDDIFVNPVLHTDNPSNTGSPSRSTLSRFYHKWFTAFSRVSLYRLGLEVPGSTIQPDTRLGFAGLIPQPQETSRATQSQEPAVLATWRNLDHEQRRDLWMSAILYALREDSHVAAKLLLVIMDRDKDLLPSYVVGDAVALICHTLLPGRRYRTPHEQSGADFAETELCLEVVSRFLECYKGMHHLCSLSRGTIGLLTRALNGTQIEGWIEKLRESSHYLSPGDRLYLATHATTRGKPAAALDLLRTISPDLMGNTYVTAACDQMLRTELPTENLSALRSNMLMLMLELGVCPDARMRDQIIALAMEAGDRQSAWDIHEQALENGITPSARTYIHLLDGVRHADDLSTLFAIYREARQSGLTPFSPQLGNALIRALFHALKGSKRSFDTMMVMYSELFNLGPLWDLGLAEDITPQRKVTRMRPPLLTLQAMTIAWIKSCTNLEKLKAMYQSWLERSGSDSSRIALTKRRPHVARALIVQFDRLGAREMCDQIMKDLLHIRSLSSPVMAVKDMTSAQAPMELDVKIWTSLIQSYTRRGQVAEAEHIVRMMRSHGIEPDSVTFEVLLLAYARNQDIPKAVETIGKKHQAGYDLDEYTLKAVGEIQDRETLRKSLQEMSFEHS